MRRPPSSARWTIAFGRGAERSSSSPASIASAGCACAATPRCTCARAPSSKRAASRWNNAIIRLYRAHDAKIIGEPGSVIDGRDSYDPLGEEGFRGVHGIAAHDCDNLELRGYEIRNTGNWAHSFWRCRDVAFSGLTILGGHDGIHFCSCDRVAIDHSTMKTGDDCVAGFDNEDVTVRDCDFNTACSAFRFGGRRVLVERCRAHGPGE